MIKNVLDYRKPKFWVIVFSIIIVMVVGIGLITNPKVNGEDKQEQRRPVVYESTQYSFRFYLPETWRGYSIVEEQWKGTINEETVETGSQLLIYPRKFGGYYLQQRSLPLPCFSVSSPPSSMKP